MTADISKDDGILLVQSARKIVTEYLKNGSKKADPKLEERFCFPSGIFVTLGKNNSLRGCIGYPLPNQALSEALLDASVAAATEDPRFRPVESGELDEITFEVTVLTPPEEIKVADPAEYPSKITVGRDGLIVRRLSYSGLLLPQVPAEYGWNEKEFLEHTCEKAGLEKNCWQRNDVTISKFQGIIFKELKPGGMVEKVL